MDQQTYLEERVDVLTKCLALMGETIESQRQIVGLYTETVDTDNKIIVQLRAIVATLEKTVALKNESLQLQQETISYQTEIIASLRDVKKMFDGPDVTKKDPAS